jgi:hypothetical protein
MRKPISGHPSDFPLYFHFELNPGTFMKVWKLQKGDIMETSFKFWSSDEGWVVEEQTSYGVDHWADYNINDERPLEILNTP